MKIDVSALKVSTGIESFLTMDFGKSKFDLIIENPPWEGLGIQFFERSRQVLKKEGKLVGIISYNQFTNLDGKPGSFNYLQKFGWFERIECFKGNSSRDYFAKETGNPVGDWCWFIWRNEPSLGKPTTIVNRLGHEFTTVLQGNEFMVPQMENEADYFDWDNGIKVKRYSNGTPKEPAINKCDVILFDLVDDKDKKSLPRNKHTEVEIKEYKLIADNDLLKFQPKGTFLFKQTSGLPYTQENRDILEAILNIPNIDMLYTTSHGGDTIRVPKIRKDIIEHLKKIKDAI